MKQFLFSILFSFLIASQALGANYAWFFSDDSVGNMAEGSDTLNNGLSALTPFKSFAKAQEKATAISDGDTVTLNFDSGDTWSAANPNRGVNGDTTVWTSARDAVLWCDDGNVIIQAYGSGARPIFDGGYDLLTNPLTGGRGITDAIITSYGAQSITVTGIELINFFGAGIYEYYGSSGVTVSDCKITNMGAPGITSAPAEYSISNVLIEDNLIDYVEMNNVYDYHTQGWGAAVHFQGYTNSSSTVGGGIFNAVIRNNRISHTGGEGIILGSAENTVPNIIEDNIISDTAHPAIHTPCGVQDGGWIIVRRNDISWTAAGRIADYSSYGVLITDEMVNELGDNGSAHYEYYQNRISGGSWAFWVQPHNDADGGWGSVRIFNNTVVDCGHAIYVGYTQATPQIFNNSFVHYTQTTSEQLNLNGYTPTTWSWGPNHWYGAILPTSPYYVTTGGNPDITGNPDFIKGSGWRALAEAAEENSYTPGIGSPIINVGIYPATYTKSGNVLTLTPSYAVAMLTIGDTAYDAEKHKSTVTAVSISAGTITLTDASAWGASGSIIPWEWADTAPDMGAVEWNAQKAVLDGGIQ